MRNIYDRVVPNNAIDTMWAFGIAAIIIFSFDALMKLLRTHFLDIAGKKSDILLSSAIFAHVMQLRLEQAPGSVGSFAKNLQDFESIRDFIASSTMALLIDLPFVVLFLVVIYVVAGPLMFVPLCAALVILVVSLLARNRIDQAIQHTYQASAAKSGLLIEALAGLEIIRANRLEGSMQRRWEDSVGEISEWSNRSRMISTTATTLSGWVQQVNTIGMAIVGVYLISAGELTMGGLIAAIMLSGRAMAPMGQIAGLIPRYNQTKTAYEGVAKVMEMPGERTEGKKYISEHAISGGYHFDNVGLTFDGQQQPSLSGVSFDIEAGSTTAVIGRIGSGKTSMLRLMVGLYQPTEGMIMLDGLNIGQIDPAELRDAVAVVEQQPHLFSGSVRDNITAASPFATDTQLMRAVKLAGVDTFTANHEEGLDRQVGERGSKLSGGQRQCVAIARALLPNPPIIIMDEPTSAMDQETEKIFIAKLAELAKDKTLIVFTQRLSLLDIADKIMVLNNGKLHKFEDKATMLGGKRG